MEPEVEPTPFEFETNDDWRLSQNDCRRFAELLSHVRPEAWQVAPFGLYKDGHWLQGTIDKVPGADAGSLSYEFDITTDLLAEQKLGFVGRISLTVGTGLLSGEINFACLHVFPEPALQDREEGLEGEASEVTQFAIDIRNRIFTLGANDGAGRLPPIPKEGHHETSSGRVEAAIDSAVKAAPGEPPDARRSMEPETGHP
jgi:hypothetical protein